MCDLQDFQPRVGRGREVSISLGQDTYNSLGLHTIFMCDSVYYGAHCRATQGVSHYACSYNLLLFNLLVDNE